MSDLFTREGTPKTPTGHDEKGRPTYTYRVVCHRCGGQGGAEQWRHSGWTCYRCGGTGTDPSSPFTGRLYTTEELEKLNATRDKRRAKVAAKREGERVAAQLANDAAWGSWYKANEGAIISIVSGCATFDYLPQVVRDVNARLDQRSIVSDRMIDVSLGIVARKYAELDARAASQHVGKIGERGEFVFIVDRTIDCSYGRFPRIPSYLNLGHDEHGNSLVYKGSNPLGDKGEVFRLRATVIEHNEYNGEKQTRIARPKFLDC